MGEGFWQHVISSSMTTANPSFDCPPSRGGDSSFQRAHKGQAGLNGLNGSAAPGHGGSDQLNGPHCVATAVTGGLAENGSGFLRGHLAAPAFFAEQRGGNAGISKTPRSLSPSPNHNPRRVVMNFREEKGAND